MAVLVEGLAIVVHRERLLEYLPGGEDAFSFLASEGLVAVDAHLLAASFATQQQAVAMGVKLNEKRLPGSRIYLGRDFAVVDQVLGVELRLPWLEFTIRDSPRHGGPVSAVAFRVEGSGAVNWDNEIISAPQNWTYDSTLRLPKKYEARGLLAAAPLSEPYQLHLAMVGVGGNSWSAIGDPETARAMLHEALGQCLDSYLEISKEVFAKLHIVLLRALRIRREPQYATVADRLHVLKGNMNAISGAHLRLVRSGSVNESVDSLVSAVSNRLTEAIGSFETLMRASAITGRARDVAQSLVDENGMKYRVLGVALAELYAKDPNVIPLTLTRSRGY